MTAPRRRDQGSGAVTGRLDAAGAARRYRGIREATLEFARPLSAEDCAAQSMPDASPAKWHLAHTTWFFETFILARQVASYRPLDPAYAVLFNSYYNSVGEQHPRPHRGLLTRPGLEQVLEYRRLVDAAMTAWLDGIGVRETKATDHDDALQVLELGLQHEQQHQELLLMDIKHLLAQNPLRPTYSPSLSSSSGGGTGSGDQAGDTLPWRWLAHAESLRSLGWNGDGFAFDNEGPRHRVLVPGYELASRLVTCGEYLKFIADGGYRRVELWLADGWTRMRAENWRAPLYWEEGPGGWEVLTLAGPQPLMPAEPVCHVSYYEADAFARWAEARLPTEAEWEAAAADLPLQGNFVESGRLHPAPAAAGTPSPGGGAPVQMFGDVWEWTASPYVPYPGYRPAAGALGEYNGKFMVNQMVMRGGSCVTPAAHLRPTYRNFFYPHMRWQFGGIRLARDL